MIGFGVIALVVLAVVLAIRQSTTHQQPNPNEPHGTPSIAPPAAPPSASVGALLDRWVAQGLLTADQADAIRRAEQAAPSLPPPVLTARAGLPAPTAGDGGLARRRRWAVAAEGMGYLGGLLVIAALISALGTNWESWPTAVHVGIGAAAALLLFGAGFVLRDRKEPAFVRLASVLWFGCVGAVAFTAGTTAVDAFDAAPRRVALAVGLCSLTAAVGLWWLRRLPPQLLAVFATLVTSTVAVVLQFSYRGSTWVGAALWVLGLTWAATVGGIVRIDRGHLTLSHGEHALDLERLIQLALGFGLAVVACMVLAATHLGVGLVVGLATSFGIAAIGALCHEPAALAVGGMGALQFVPRTALYYLGDRFGTPMTLLLTGAVLLAIAAALVHHRTQGPPPTVAHT